MRMAYMQRLFETIQRYLVYFLTAYVLVDYLVRNSGLSFLASSWDELLFILIIGVWILLSGVKRVHPVGGKLVIPLLLFYTVVFLTFLIKNGETSIALMELRALIEYTFWFFVGLNLVRDRQQAKNVCDIFLVVGLVVALYGIYQYVAGVEIPASSGGQGGRNGTQPGIFICGQPQCSREFPYSAHNHCIFFFHGRPALV